jgi:hypothetical protein
MAEAEWIIDNEIMDNFSKSECDTKVPTSLGFRSLGV